MSDEQQYRKAAPSGRTWSRRSTLTATAIGGVGALTGGLTACSNDSDGPDSGLKEKISHAPKNMNKKGFPIVADPITVKFMTNKPVETAKDYNKVAAWKKYQNLTNIRVKWGLTSEESLQEKQNLALSSGDYPEIFYATHLSNSDQVKYGNQGVFVKLNDLIDNYMPNLKALMKDNPDIKKGMIFPDGGIYGLPYVCDPEFTAMRIEFKPWIRGDWLDKLDMEMPTTTAEYHRYLKKVKKTSPNGKSGHTIPYGEALKGGGLYDALRGSFGIGNRGKAQNYVDAEPNNEDRVRFYPISDGYKALMEYLHRLYSENLIAKNIFSIDQSKAFEAMNKGVYGSTFDIAPYNLRGGQAKHFVPMPALKGPEGHHAYHDVFPSLKLIGVFVLTDKCEHLLEMARWADYFYSDAGSKLYFMGVEGKSYTETKNGVEYVDKIRHPAKGLTQDEAQKPYVTYMGGGIGPVILKQKYFKGAESTKESVKAAELLQPDAQMNVWPAFTFTEDETQQLESLSDDIEKYVDESRDKFISGTWISQNGTSTSKRSKGWGWTIT